jgi:hypothetical protein
LLLHILEEVLEAARKGPGLHYGYKLFTAYLECLGSPAFFLALFIFSPLRFPASVLDFGLLLSLLA